MLKADKMAVGKTDNSADFQPTIWRNLCRKAKPGVKNGHRCTVIARTHTGKSGIIQDLNTSKTGAITITVLQDNGVRFKTLAKNTKTQGSF